MIGEIRLFKNFHRLKSVVQLFRRVCYYFVMKRDSKYANRDHKLVMELENFKEVVIVNVRFVFDYLEFLS